MPQGLFTEIFFDGIMFLTSKNKMKLLRGIVDIFPEINPQEFFKTQRRIKLGFDPTSDFLHLGHSVLLRKLGQFQSLGHVPIIIIGDFTARIGDPTGKSTTRVQLSKDEVDSNVSNFLKIISKFVDIEKSEIVFNSTHLEKLTLSEIIQLQSTTTVNQLLAKQDFSNRLKNQTSIGLHEFMYPILQGFDSHIISSDVELGGTDQKFNVSMGRSIQRQFVNEKEQIGMLMPILNGTDGTRKMSKSLGNAIKIDEHPLLMFSQLEKIPDSLVNDFITLLTECDLNSFSENPRERQKQMAFEVVSSFHDKESAIQAQRNSEKIVLSSSDASDVPELSISSINFPISLATLLKELNLMKSSSDARRAIQSGSVKLNGIKVMNEKMVVTHDEVLNSLIQTSKKSFHRLVV